MNKVAISLMGWPIGAQPLADLVPRCCVPLAEAAISGVLFGASGVRASKIDCTFARSAAMDWKQLITADPQVLHGAVRFVGTRIPVTVVLDNLADGATPEDIVAQYPALTSLHIQAALGYAADLARERVVTVPA